MLFFFVCWSVAQNVFINSVKKKKLPFSLLCSPQFRNCLNFLKRLFVTSALRLSRQICWEKKKKLNVELRR